jgi:hypothetical protein
VIALTIKEGDALVYGKTGTTGRVVRITELDGKVWVELDSTGLLYDANVLEPTDPAKLKKGRMEYKDKESREEQKGKVIAKREVRERRSGIEDMKDEGTLDSSAGICGAG